MTQTQSYVDDLVDWTCGALLQAGEVLTASFSGEDSDFVRFNGDTVRQAGSVRQREITLDLIEGRRHCAASGQLSGDAELDRARVRTLVIVSGEEDMLVSCPSSAAYIEAAEESLEMAFQSFEVVSCASVE